MKSYLTQEEIGAIQELPRETPYLISGVSMTMFSIARFYGGAKYNGRKYTYMPDTDELIRDDVLKFVTRVRKKAKRKPSK